MANILDEIINNKRVEIQQSRQVRPLSVLKEQVHDLPRCRNFYKAVTKKNPRGINVIAEVKKASPSAGVIRKDFDPVKIAKSYESCGADAISCLTDEKYFHGKLQYIQQIKHAVKLPVMRKDFIVDIYQVYESRIAGADAILLIADALRNGVLMDLMIEAAELGLTVLLEVHSVERLMKIRSLIGFPRKGYSVLGINNRDLTTMQVDINTTGRMAELLDSTNELVAESGIKTREDVQKLVNVGARAVLIGQTLCEQPDIKEKFQELFGRKDRA